MNNYYISISNGLLDGQHQKRMGTAVWQFMWCIDKITRIDDDGTGWVLGGKPINLEDFKGTSRNTVSRNLQKLERAGYLRLIHTPYGISIRVMKAKKRFNKSDKPVGNRFTKNVQPNSRNGEPRPKNGEPNKIYTVDRTVDKDSLEKTEKIKNDISRMVKKFGVRQ